MMVWLTLVLVWFVLTVLRGQRARFAFGALIGAFLVIAALDVAVAIIPPDTLEGLLDLAGRSLKQLQETALAGHQEPGHRRHAVVLDGLEQDGPNHFGQSATPQLLGATGVDQAHQAFRCVVELQHEPAPQKPAPPWRNAR